jgi:hypothetical protein
MGCGSGRRRCHYWLAEASKTRDSKHYSQKRKAWGGREGDGELTKTKKKDSNPPASPDDEQQQLLRVSNLLGSVSSDLARNLDGKRKEGTHSYTFIDLA